MDKSNRELNLNLPRWDDSRAYPKRKSELSDDQWVWEFLRRTWEYRFDWLKYGPADFVGSKYNLDRLISPDIPAIELGKHIFQSLSGSLIDQGSHEPQELLKRGYELVVIQPEKNLDDQWERAKKLITKKRANKKYVRSRQRGTNAMALLLNPLTPLTLNPTIISLCI